MRMVIRSVSSANEAGVEAAHQAPGRQSAGSGEVRVAGSRNKSSREQQKKEATAQGPAGAFALCGFFGAWGSRRPRTTVGAAARRCCLALC